MATHVEPGSRTPAVNEPESTVSLLQRLMGELSTLFRQEMSLAISEISRSLSSAKTGVASIATSGAVLFAAVLLLLEALVLGLAEVMRPWLAALIVGLVVGIVGYVMLQAGKKKLEPSALKPVQTQESLRRDKELLQRRGP
jgi:hypothetical protein